MESIEAEKQKGEKSLPRKLQLDGWKFNAFPIHPRLHSSFQFCNPLLAQRLQGQSAGAYTWVALSFMHEVEAPSASLGHCPNRYEPTMVSSEEVRRTRGCRGRQVFSTAAAQGTLARQGGKEKKIRLPKPRFSNSYHN